MVLELQGEKNVHHVTYLSPCVAFYLFRDEKTFCANNPFKYIFAKNASK